MTAEQPVLIYEVDREEVLTSVGGNWDEFAGGNQGRRLSGVEVVGKRLLDFVRGEEVRMIYRTFHQLAWKDPDRTIRFDYRCDGDLVRRYMKMEIRAIEDRIRYVSTIEREVPFDRPIALDYAGREGEFLLMCAWCKRFVYPRESGNWRELEEIFSIAPEQFSISHGICPACLEEVRRQTRFRA